MFSWEFLRAAPAAGRGCPARPRPASGAARQRAPAAADALHKSAAAQPLHQYKMTTRGLVNVSVGGTSFSVRPRYGGFKVIGRGSYGVVVSATDSDTKKKVAIKRIKPMSGPISASRSATVPSRHRRVSCPSDEVVGGFFFEFEAVRTESSDRDAPRRS